MSTLNPTLHDVVPPTPSTPSTTSEGDLDAQIAALTAGGISLGETFGIAVSSLTANKLRTLLTALGIIIGVAAVVALMAIGNGSQASITASITANGANLLTVRSGSSNAGGVRSAVGGSQTLTTKDADALADTSNVPDASYISPEYSSNAQVVAGSQNTNSNITGIKAAYQTVHNMTISEGAFITDDDSTSMNTVTVLGATVATTLFPTGDPVGQSIRIAGQAFTVVGVLTAKGGTGFGSTDDAIFVPLATAQRKLFGGRAVSGGSALLSSIAVQAKDATSVTAALGEIQATLRTQHNLATDGTKDDFSVINQADQLASATSTTKTLTIFLGAIAGISLLVGGIGIMNIMLVSVRERTREIGLRKAIGAREADILTQFMLEALVISLTGALIGLAIGVAIALIVNATGLVTTSLSFGSSALAVGVAMATGLFFGIAPARSAARLDPIEALRYD